MYKLLPILLFAFLLAEEKSAPLIIQSDSLDFIWAEEQLDLGINKFKKQVANIINEDKFLINFDRKVYDVMRVDYEYHAKQNRARKENKNQMLDSLLNEMKNNYPPKNRVTSKSIRLGERYWRLEVYAINVEVNVDKSIELDYSIKRTILDIINNIFSGAQAFDMENIIFNSVDINKLINKNKQLSFNRDDIYDNSWAVIIGIDKYKYSDQLNYAVNDAEAVKDMLISKFDFPEENIRYLTDEEATLSNIKLNLGEVATSAGENDRILVFYSGHGETLPSTDGSEKGYILPFEGRQDKPYATGFAMDEILTASQVSKSKHMLFLMDACYSGLMTERGKGLAKPKGDRALLKLANQKARQIITAGGSGEQVIERDEWQHSAFTKNLLSGLDNWEADPNNRGYVTADELGTYLRDNVIIDSGEQQIPQKGRFRNSGGGEFVFFSSHNTINQNVEDKSADVKLDLEPLELAELKGYPLHIIFMSLGNDLTMLGVGKQLATRSVVAFSYSKSKWEGIGYLRELKDNYVSVSTDMIHIGFGYYLRSQATPLFNPVVSGSVISAFYRVEDQTRQLSDDWTEISFSLGLINYVKLFKKVAIDFGIGGAFDPYFTFDENEKLYRVGYDWSYGPVLFIDITNPFSKETP